MQDLQWYIFVCGYTGLFAIEEENSGAIEVLTGYSITKLVAKRKLLLAHPYPCRQKCFPVLDRGVRLISTTELLPHLRL